MTADLAQSQQMGDTEVATPQGVTDGDYNMMMVKLYNDDANPAAAATADSQKTMDINVMKQQSSGATDKKKVENLANPIWMTLPIKGGPNVKCQYLTAELEVVELEGETTDPNKFIRCKTTHLSSFTSTDNQD